MQNYKEILSKLDDERSDELISNGSKEHAQALIYQCFAIMVVSKFNRPIS